MLSIEEVTNDFPIIVKDICDKLDECGMLNIPMLCMVIEEMSRRNNSKLLDFYDRLKEVSASVVEEYGDVI